MMGGALSLDLDYSGPVLPWYQALESEEPLEINRIALRHDQDRSTVSVFTDLPQFPIANLTDLTTSPYKCTIDKVGTTARR